MTLHRIDTHALPHAIEAFQLEFTGSASEFFRVWIVNVLLSIVTIGFYTPYARRRTAQYFWGHTMVAHSPLEFSVQQKKMVIGFILMAALYALFRFASETGQDTVVSVMMLAAAGLAPYFWASAMRFRLGATRWRGVRLQFTASWAEVYKASWPVFVIAGAWIVTTLVIGALAPDDEKGPGSAAVLPVVLACLIALVVSVLCIIRLEFNFKSLLVARGRIGGQAGRWKPVYGDFVRIWAATIGVFLVTLLVVGVLLAAAIGGSVAMLGSFKGKPGLMAVVIMIAMAIAAVVILFLASAPARAYREARIFQLVWNNIGVSHVARFKCNLRVGRYVALRVKNILLSFLTLGFYRPFAMISEYRMKTESVTLHVKGGLEQLAGQLAREEQGIGDAMADAVGLDLVG